MTEDELISILSGRGGDDDDGGGCPDEFLHFERIEHPRSTRPDIHAFLLVNELVPGSGDIIDNAAHDEIWISVEPSELAPLISREQATELTRCGVRYDRELGRLAMFV